MATKSIFTDPYQLAAQLHARLSDCRSFPGICQLLEAAQSAKIPCLYPSVTCFEKPGGPLVHTLAGHTSLVNWAVVSKDGKRLVSVSHDNTLKIWSMISGELIRSIDLGFSYNVVVLYHNDTCAAMGSWIGFLAIDLESEEELYKDSNLMGQRGTCLASAANGNRMAMCGGEKIVIFDTKSKVPKVMRTIEDKAEELPGAGYNDIIHGGGNFMAYTRGNQKEVKIIHIYNHSFKKTVKVPVNVMHFQLNSSGTELIALGSDTPLTEAYKDVRLMIWETSNWNLIKDVKSQFDHVWIIVHSICIIETKQGLELIWPILDRINFWNLETNKERVALKSGYQGNQFKHCHSSDGKLLAVVSPDYNQRAIQVYDLDLLEYTEGGDKYFTSKEKAKVHAGQGERDAFLHPEDRDVILSIPTTVPIITFWDTKSHNRIRTLRFDKMFPAAIYPIGDSSLAIWENIQKKIYLVNVEEGKIESETQSQKLGDIPASFAHNQTWSYLGNFIMITSSEIAGDLHIWNLKAGEILHTLKTGMDKKLQTMNLSADKSTLVCAFQDNDPTVKTLPVICFDMESKTIISKIEVENMRIDLKPEVSCLTDNGSLLFILEQDMTAINVIDIKSGNLIRKLQYEPERAEDELMVHSSDIVAISLTQKGGFLLACTNVSVQMKNRRLSETQHRTVAYDIDSWKTSGFLKAGWFDKMMFSKDGQRLATKSRAFQEQIQAIELWDTSRVKSEGKFTLIGRFLPDTGVGFCHATIDATSIVVGIAGTADIVFLKPCGSGKAEEKSEKCIDLIVPAPEGLVLPDAMKQVILEHFAVT